MNIGFDAKRAFLNYSGLGNYSRSVIESLAENFPDEIYYLFNPEKSNQFLTERKNSQEINSNSFSKSYWRSYGQVNDWNKLHIDVYHGLSNELPFGLSRSKAKKVVTIHDVIFKSHPQFYSAIDRSIYDWKTKHAVKHADTIITVSQFTKNELIKYYGADEKKIKVVYQSLSSHITRNISSGKIISVKNKYNLPEQFLLYAGTIEKRKNLLAVIKALQELGENAPPLVVVGRATNYFHEIEKYLQSVSSSLKILFLHEVSNDELNEIYSLAYGFIYTSLIEGFGIPLIEAAAHGVPSITTKNSSMSEAAGNGALHVDAMNVDETASAIERLFSDTALHKKLSAQAFRHVQPFNHKRMATELMEIYKSL